MCIVSAPRTTDHAGDPRPPASLLRDAFISDHQAMIRGFRDLRDALERHDDSAAAAIADRLDRSAGAHIEFEERDYYPVLREWLGRDRVEEMYDEHGTGFAAILALAFRPASMGVSSGERARLMENVDVALDHAVACGAALAYLDELDEPRQQKLLDALYAARERGHRWSELERYAARDE